MAQQHEAARINDNYRLLRQVRRQIMHMGTAVEGFLKHLNANDVAAKVKAITDGEFISTEPDAPTKEQYLTVLQGVLSVAYADGKITLEDFQALTGGLLPVDASEIPSKLDAWV